MVLDLMRRAKIIIWQSGSTPGTWWELETIARIADPERVILIVPSQKNDPLAYHEFRSRANGVLPVPMPRGVTDGLFIFFRDTWEPTLSETRYRPRILWFFTVGTISFRKSLGVFLQRLTSKGAPGVEARRFCGPRFNPAQVLLFGQLVDTAPLDVVAVEQESGQKLQTRPPRHKHGLQSLPPHLERIPVIHDLTPGHQKCPCCGKMRLGIGIEVTEQLEFQGAWLRVFRHERCKWVCDDCDAKGHDCQTERGPKLAHSFEINVAGPGLVASVVMGKLADKLTPYELERRFATEDVHIAGNTICGWIMSAAELVGPLVMLMAGRVRQSKVINTHETPVLVGCSPATTSSGGCHEGRVLVYIGDESRPYLAFVYSADHTSSWPEGFSGYRQSHIYRGGVNVIEVGCWAHGRRQFIAAQDTDSRRAAELLTMVRKLYAVEDAAAKKIATLGNVTHDQAADIRSSLRQQQSIPVLAEIKNWLGTESKLIAPCGPMAEAINHLLSRWDALNAYTTAGFLSIDNAVSERALKMVAIEPPNCFAGNDKFATCYATFYSLIASAERHGLSPQEYLTGVLTQIPTTSPSDLEQLLPDLWKARVMADNISGQASTPKSPPIA
jgi:transposase